MTAFLTFAIAAPIAAMGELAVGERRTTWDRPGRSAVLGLVAACLGLERDDETAHADLEAGFGLALRIARMGPLLTDYHTAQVPPTRRGRRFATRAEELAADDLETILSRRDYRMDALVLVALWRHDNARWQLADIERAMQAPRFTPYFGRKSCPLMLPLAPLPTEAADPIAALAYRAECGPEPERHLAPSGAAVLITMTAADVRQFGLSDRVRRVEFRRDAIASRRRWQFDLRDEAILAEAP
ncbi:MAG: type I-E CRISPR-associated protein Cas5/CasD [Alphaproteobacteria bacterium]